MTAFRPTWTHAWLLWLLLAVIAALLSIGWEHSGRTHYSLLHEVNELRPQAKQVPGLRNTVAGLEAQVEERDAEIRGLKDRIWMQDYEGW